MMEEEEQREKEWQPWVIDSQLSLLNSESRGWFSRFYSFIYLCSSQLISFVWK